MAAHEGSRPTAEGASTAVTTAEEARLDAAMQTDERLLSSLREEDRRRRKRRLISGVAIMFGSIAIGATLWVAVNGLAPAASSAASTNQTSVEAGQRGWKLWNERKYTEAEPLFEQAVAADETFAAAWNGLGWTRFHLGKDKEATAAFERALELDADLAGAKNGLGWLHYRATRFEEARAIWKPLAEDGVQPAQVGLAQLALLQERWEDATKWITKLRESGDRSLLTRTMARAAEQEEVSDALRRRIDPTFERVADTASAADPADVQRGWQLFGQMKYKEAGELFAKALAADPAHPAANNGMGFVLLNRGKPAQAKPHFEKALEKWPNGAGPLNGLARVYKETGDVDRAIRLWKRADDPDMPNAATWGLAQTYMERGEHDEAATYWRRIVDADPTNQQARAQLELATGKQ